MKLYRLVNVAYDPVTVGQYLTRPSNHSNQKNGEGMYFAVDRQSAISFNKNVIHTYTHLVECDLPDFYEENFADTNIIKRKWEETIIQSIVRFCADNKLKGVKWQASNNKWIEYVVLSEHIGIGFLITASEKL